MSPMSHLTKMRTIFYSLVLAIGVAQTIVASFCAIFDGFSGLRVLFGRIALGFSLPTWILASILLAYNNRPSLSNIFTKKTLHLVSFYVITFLWLAIGAMVLSQAPTECNFEEYSDGLAGVWCAFTVSTGAVGFLLAIVSAMAVIFIHKSEADVNGNIAGAEVKPLDAERAT